MMNKSLAKKTLVIILSLNMVGSVDALNFSGMWNSLRSTVNRVCTHRLTKPVAIGLAVSAVVVGTAGYLIKRNYDQRCQNHWQNYLKKGLVAFGGLSVAGRSMTVGEGADQVKVGQVVVLDQCSPQGCGGASCGYQTLKNAVAIASLAKGHDWSNWLTDGQQAATLFAKPSSSQKAGEWREHVIRYRQRRLLNNAIEEKMPLAPAPAVDTDLDRPDLNELYVELRNSYVERIITRVLSGHPVEVTFDSFVQWIQRRLKSWSI